MKTILQDKDQWSSDMKVRMKNDQIVHHMMNKPFSLVVETWCIPIKSIIK